MDTTFLTLGAFLIGIGCVLLLTDLFIASGVLFALALASVAAGVVFVFKYDTTVGLYTLAGVTFFLPLSAWLLVRLGPFRRLVHQPETDDTAASLPANVELLHLKGRIGKTISALRPAGVVDFDGRRVDSLTEGMMVDPGHWVRCIDVRAGKVVVRPIDRASVNEMETMDFN